MAKQQTLKFVSNRKPGLVFVVKHTDGEKPKDIGFIFRAANDTEKVKKGDRIFLEMIDVGKIGGVTDLHATVSRTYEDMKKRVIERFGERT